MSTIDELLATGYGWVFAKAILALIFAIVCAAHWSRDVALALLACLGFTMEVVLVLVGIWLPNWLNAAAAQGMPPEELGYWVGMFRVLSSVWGSAALLLLGIVIVAGLRRLK